MRPERPVRRERPETFSVSVDAVRVAWRRVSPDTCPGNDFFAHAISACGEQVVIDAIEHLAASDRLTLPELQDALRRYGYSLQRIDRSIGRRRLV